MKKKAFYRIAILFFWVHTFAADISLAPISDAFVHSGLPNTNFGSENYLVIGYDWEGDHWEPGVLNVNRGFLRTYIKFDFSSIPTGATIC